MRQVASVCSPATPTASTIMVKNPAGRSRARVRRPHSPARQQHPSSDRTAPEAILRRDRILALVVLLLIAAVAWGWIFHEAARMSAMRIPGMHDMRMSHMQMVSSAFKPWSTTLALYLCFMWFVMMIAMMIPSFAPLVLGYLGVAQTAATRARRFASTGWVLAGYLVAWAEFALLAALAHWWLESSRMLTPTLQIHGSIAGAALLILAGIYQWLPWKAACLARCRAPLDFIQQHGGFAPRAPDAVRLGFMHGLYCMGSCGLLVLVLFFGGVMNLWWIAGLAGFVLIEKLAPHARWIGRAAGVAAVAWGLWSLWAAHAAQAAQPAMHAH